LYKFSKPLYIQKSKFYSEIILLSFRPIRPFGRAAAHSFFSFQPAAPSLPTGPRPLGWPSRLTRWWRLARLPPPPQEAASSCAAFTLPSRPADRSTLTCHPSPPAHPSSAVPPPPPAAPRAAQPYLECHPSFYHPAIIFPSLIPLLTSPPPSMVLTPLTPPLLPPTTPLRRSPDPYKRAMRPPTLTAPHPLSPELFCTLLRPRDELKPPLFVASGAPPLRHPSVTGEHLPSTASTGSSSPSIIGEHRRASAPACRTPVRHRRALCPWSTVDRRCPRSTAPWTRSMEFSVENLIRKLVISGILQRGPSVFPKSTRSA
jgi:hypothetical protein